MSKSTHENYDIWDDSNIFNWCSFLSNSDLYLDVYTVISALHSILFSLVLIALGIDKNTAAIYLWSDSSLTKWVETEKVTKAAYCLKICIFLTSDKVATLEFIFSSFFFYCYCLLLSPDQASDLPFQLTLFLAARHFSNDPYHVSPLLRTSLWFPHIFRIKSIQHAHQPGSSSPTFLPFKLLSMHNPHIHLLLQLPEKGKTCAFEPAVLIVHLC